MQLEWPFAGSLQLSNGVWMPRWGLGTTMLNGPAGEAAITEALRLGYRLLDTAQAYGNEAELGSALKRSGVPREEVFIATKRPGCRAQPAWCSQKTQNSDTFANSEL